MNPECPQPQAVATKNGYIVALGDHDSIFRIKGRKTRLVDLEGKRLMPGRISIEENLSDEILKDSIISTDDVSLDYDTAEKNLKKAIAAFRRRGITSIFNFAKDAAKEVVCRELITDILNKRELPLRYFGSYRLDKAIRSGTVTDLLDTQCKSCITLKGCVNYDTLCLDLRGQTEKSTQLSTSYICDISSAAANRGYNIRLYTDTKKAALSVLETFGNLAATYPKYAFVIICPEEISQQEQSDAAAEGVLLLPRDNCDINAAAIIGKKNFLGSLEKGKMADIVIFENGQCVQTFISGKEIPAIDASR